MTFEIKIIFLLIHFIFIALFTFLTMYAVLVIQGSKSTGIIDGGIMFTTLYIVSFIIYVIETKNSRRKDKNFKFLNEIKEEEIKKKERILKKKEMDDFIDVEYNVNHNVKKHKKEIEGDDFLMDMVFEDS